MTAPRIDASLGTFEERVRREASEEFWRYIALSADIGPGSLIDHASRISGLRREQLRKLATLHWLLSDEVGQLLEALPTALARLSRTTSPVVGVGPEVRGALDWGATIGLRASRGSHAPEFVFDEAQAENDTPANRVLKTALRWVERTGRFFSLGDDELLGDPATSSRWLDEASRRVNLAYRALRHVGLVTVRAPERLSEHDLRAASAEPARGYRRAAGAARLRRSLVDLGEQDAIRRMLHRRLLIPSQQFRLFEIWILSRIARYFRSAGLEEVSAPLIGDRQSIPVYRFARNDVSLVDVYFQGLPVIMREQSRYRDIFASYDLDAGARTPDIVVQRGPDRLIVEAKASDDPRYVADGAYKTLGYLSDFATTVHAPDAGPSALLVTKSLPRLLAGVSRIQHELWISTIERLDSDLELVLHRFTV